MTELRIDGVAVELPSTFSIAIKRENPFFTKAGEYTYDIELPLEGSVNASLYRFLHRINSVADIKVKRRAQLIADNRVYLDGTEIITGWTEKNVKIQLVSGNSELNYLADDKLLISEVKMCTTPVDFRNPDTRYIHSEYPAVDFCLPFVLKTSGEMVNKWRLDRSAALHKWCAAIAPAEFDFVPQPFLCAYIRELIQGLGYRLTHNDLEDTFIKHTFLVHSQPTYSWNEMLPGMTVREFLEAVEKTFNVSLQINFRHRSVAIKMNNRYFHEAPCAYVRNVVDSYDCDVEQPDDSAVAHSIENMTLMYDFPNSKYYQNARLTDFARNNVIVKSSSSAADFTRFFETEETSQNKVYAIASETDPARQFGQQEVATHKEWVWKYVDFFREWKSGTGEAVVKMKIIPAEMQRTTFISSKGSNDVFNWACNAVVAGDTVAKESKDMNLDDILSMEKENQGSAQLRYAIYLPVHQPATDDVPAPEAFTDYTYPGLSHPVPVPHNQNPPLSLRPSELQINFYSGGYEIDIKHPVKISSFDVNLFDASSVFIINNRRFLCKEIEYTISAEGRNGAWVGTFYNVRLSDTEMYKRWILSDGRWRDGGVWLDDGRWLDEPPVKH